MARYLWVIAAAVAIGLLQLAAYQYLRGRGGTSGEAREGSGSGRALGAEHEPGRRSTNGSERRCPTCGTPNDPTYTFCRWCVGRLNA